MLTRQTVRRHVGRNDIIFSRGQPGDGLYVVENGRVSIGREGPAGNELIVAILKSGEYFGELALFDDEPRSATATAVDSTSLLFLSRRAFLSFLDSHPRALATCLQVVVRELRRCTDLADEIALLGVRSRLARRLLRMAENETQVRVTQHHLAGMIGVKRESVNKHLNALVDEGAIQLGRGRIIIVDRPHLESYADEIGEM